MRSDIIYGGIGWKGLSTPAGSFETPFNAISLMLEVGATFIARAFAGENSHLTEILVQAIEHRGFSFIEVLQPTVPYHSWREYREKVEFLEKLPETYEEAMKTAKIKHKYSLGVFYKTQRPVYHEGLYGNHNPITKKLSREIRLEKIGQVLKT